VSALCYNKEIGVVVSGSFTGRLCVHLARSGLLLRCICDLEGRGISVVCTAGLGYIAVHTAHDKMLTLFWVNGQRLTQVQLPTEITCMAVNRNTSNVFVCGHGDGSLSFLQTWDLKVVRVIDTLKEFGAITSIAFSQDTQVLLVGSKSGVFSVVADGDREVEVEMPRSTSPPIMMI
jgi:WD40 repeat protein